ISESLPCLKYEARDGCSPRNFASSERPLIHHDFQSAATALMFESVTTEDGRFLQGAVLYRDAPPLGAEIAPAPDRLRVII
ncbi:MAG: hypothetical protein ACRD1O_03015, partial [Terriglobia bacterium]